MINLKYNYMKKARTLNMYHALKHRFFRYATADLANRAAGHVHQNAEETKNALAIMSDAFLVDILKRWQNHCEKGSNRKVCATCGIIGLTKSTTFKISECVIDAFKVPAKI